MMAKLQALERHEPLGDRVYATLRDYLRAGRIATGRPLQEAALAAQLGVSRTPVRAPLAPPPPGGPGAPRGRDLH